MPAIPVYGIVEKRCPHRRTKSRSKAYTGFSGRIARPLRGQFAADCAAKIFPFPLQARHPRGDCTGAAVPTFPLQALRHLGDCTGTEVPTFPLQALRPAPGGVVQGRQPLPFPCRRSAALGEIVQGRQSLRTPNAGAPPCTRVTFVARRKSPKACQGDTP